MSLAERAASAAGLSGGTDSGGGGSAAGDAPPGAPVAVRPGRAVRALVARGRRVRAGIPVVLAAPEDRRSSARQVYEAVRAEMVRAQLSTMPLSRIRDTGQGRLRLSALEDAGYRTVASVTAARENELEAIPGVGPQTAAQVLGAARQLQAAMERDAHVRFDPDARTKLQGELLGGLWAYEAAKRSVSPHVNGLHQLSDDLDPLLADAAHASSRIRMFFSGSRRRDQGRAALGRLRDLLESPDTVRTEAGLSAALAAIRQRRPGAKKLWRDYESRAVVYNGLLIEIGELTTDAEASQGFVPADIAQLVHQHPLDLSLMRVSLRGYQAFGAKFALAQKRSILGDEMGLGKSVEALAAMCHLHTRDEKHFLVICPASVIVNWTREVQRHSELKAHRLHGPERTRNVRAWAMRGGVGITTYEALRSLPNPRRFSLGMLVVDEAHYVKNPAAARTRAVLSWSDRTDRVLFLTGTPMENRVEEFRTLVGHLRPEVAEGISATDGVPGLSPTRFRRAVAPVYLRRDQSDVLSELPPRIDSEEWVELDGPALAAYRAAVFSGNFMAMRRAAYAPGTPEGSAKLRRLVEIADEAASNGRKVVVFSFFRDVLESVAAVLGDRTVGPLTGSLRPVARQALIDEFTARKGPAVLVSQIEAGGVGLNIQAASVVILAEPQWKPTVEDQAIARCHRMGQVRIVDVHRLLTEDSVDQRMLEVLATKSQLFNDYARRSVLKEISRAAVDVSDLNAHPEAASQAENERRILALEQARLRGQPQAPATAR